jgi:hypothetical protein
LSTIRRRLTQTEEAVHQERIAFRGKPGPVPHWVQAESNLANPEHKNNQNNSTANRQSMSRQNNGAEKTKGLFAVVSVLCKDWLC